MVTHSDCNACLNPTRVDKSENSCTEGKREKKKGGRRKALKLQYAYSIHLSYCNFIQEIPTVMIT